MTSVNMDSLSSEQHSISEFILKLYNILENQEFSGTICWSSDGAEVQIKSQKRMEEMILPSYFRHQKLESFIRQLNMYRFKKISKVGAQRKYVFFKNELFRKGNLQELHLILRKKKGQEDQDTKHKPALEEYKQFIKQNVQRIQEDIHALRRKHPEILPQLAELLNSTSVLTGECYKQNSETDESQHSFKNLSAPSLLFVSNNDFQGYESMGHFDSICSIDLDLRQAILY